MDFKLVLERIAKLDLFVQNPRVLVRGANIPIFTVLFPFSTSYSNFIATSLVKTPHTSSSYDMKKTHLSQKTFSIHAYVLAHRFTVNEKLLRWVSRKTSVKY